MGKDVVNGLEVQQIQDMVAAVSKQPAIAQSRFYAKTEWKSGFENNAVIKDFSLGGAVNSSSRKAAYKIVGDHPPELLGTNKGPSSVELVLAALGHCIASGFATYGAYSGVPLESVVVDVEGDIDLQGMLALPKPRAVRPGFQAIRATYRVKSKAPRKKLEELAKMAEDLSPTRDSLKAVPFSSKLVVE